MIPPRSRGEGIWEAAYEGSVLDSTDAFDAAFSGHTCQLVREDGLMQPLATHLWRGDPSPADRLLFVEPCHGRTLDVGCGPGRLAGAIASRGIEVLGLDTSAEAVRLTRARGAMALRRDIFGPLHLGRRWSHVLLADGNVGLGGNPVRLLRRVRKLLDENGTVLVELAGGGVVSSTELVRLRLEDAMTPPFLWSVLSVDDVAQVGAEAGFLVMGVRTSDDRVVATLRPRAG